MGIIGSPRKDKNTTYSLSKTLEYENVEKEATCYLPKEIDGLIQEKDREITRIKADYPWTQINL